MTIGIAGAGSIGVAMAVVFARAGQDVRCWDPFPDACHRAATELDDRLDRLHRGGLLDEDPAAVAGRVSFVGRLEVAVEDADLVQECAPERLDVKQALYARLAELTGAGVPLASSSSALRAGLLAEGNGAADRILVAHPANPPYLLPVIELVPSTATDPSITRAAAELYAGAGLHPIALHREVEGFVFNRLQGAVLREAYCLVRDGVVDVADLDAVVTLGLGRRWSVIGPFETVDLNTRGGIEAHAEKMGPAYERMGRERGQHDPWTPDLVATVAAQRRALLPLEEWDRRVAWRDERLIERARADAVEPVPSAVS
ncbi:3-hydroxyacyl-CoA dehydrogenase [Nocardioides nitrophenolicus]|uniref:3-hydroxyacyl-CoA dehydrogenase n=1 Tax=Nocardioides nitrophenolicus TaxID=60489 RepID=UPI0019599589|nr:3-hydroxyacyl-CoA dehydrogenase [Nocardioides nitrophenolicus]MBM7517460.1 3-hydroxyacyl-CoA dehydrogenase [Nocardioides nitrophenolicus]